MSDDPDQNYRPRSPNLSSYNRPDQPPSNDSGAPPGYSFQTRRSYDASPYFSPQTATIPSSYFNPQSYSTPRASLGSISEYSSGNPQAPTYPTQEFRQSTTPIYPPAPSRIPSQTNPFYPQLPNPPILTHLDTKMVRRRKSEEVDADDVDYSPNGPAGGRASKRARKTDSIATAAEHQLPPPATHPHFAGVEVKTRFPVARIKRIMQADEDVGKLAMAAPIAVAKALELFMISLVTRAASEAKEKNSKRVTAMHLKQTVQKDKQFDFLEEVISKVSDHQPEGKAKGRGRSESAEPPGEEGDGDGGGNAKRKKSGGTRRRKTGDGDDD